MAVIKATEINKIFRYDTNFDLSSNMALELKFIDPQGATSSITNPRVTAPAVTVGNLLANEYMEFTTLATDFTVTGTWTVCGVYTDAVPTTFFGNDATFTVEAAC